MLVRLGVLDIVGTTVRSGDEVPEAFLGAFRGVGMALRELQAAGGAVVLNTGLDRETARRLVRALGWDALGLGGVVAGDDVCA